MGWLSQRPGHIAQRLADLQVSHLGGCLAYALENQADSSGGFIRTGNSQGDSLARIGVRRDNHELTCLAGIGHQRGLHIHQEYIFR